MVRRITLVLVGTALSLAAPRAWAQKGDSGSIVGCVMDQGGAPLKGIKVSASSATQIGGKKNAYTNEEGCYRFPMLDPGVFEVRSDAPKLRTVIQQNVRVGINAPTEINLVMEVASDKVEEVKVVEKAPLVNTKSAGVKEVFDLDFVDSLPHENRDVIFQQVTNYSAGSINGRIRGGAVNQSIYTMDGFTMFRAFPTVKAQAAYEIQTAGYGADNVMASLERHNAEVIRRIPADRLLLFDPTGGWEPLCRFLGVAIPSEPFPRTNARDDFWVHSDKAKEVSAR